MIRITALISAGLLAASIAAPPVAADDGRTATRPYTITRGKIHLSDDAFAWWIGTQEEFFRARAGERSVRIALTDDTGRPVAGRVEINGDVVNVCSETQKAIRVSSGQKLAVSAIFGPCDGDVSLVTEGTIIATFSK